MDRMVQLDRQHLEIRKLFDDLEILKNHTNDQFVSKLEFSGGLENLDKKCAGII